MPLYEYHCRKCDRPFEVLVSSRPLADVRCSVCDSDEVDQLIGLPAAGRVSDSAQATNCRGDGPPCGASWCGRRTP